MQAASKTARRLTNDRNKQECDTHNFSAPFGYVAHAFQNNSEYNFIIVNVKSWSAILTFFENTV